MCRWGGAGQVGLQPLGAGPWVGAHRPLWRCRLVPASRGLSACAAASGKGRPGNVSVLPLPVWKIQVTFGLEVSLLLAVEVTRLLPNFIFPLHFKHSFILVLLSLSVNKDERHLKHPARKFPIRFPVRITTCSMRCCNCFYFWKKQGKSEISESALLCNFSMCLKS